MLCEAFGERYLSRTMVSECWKNSRTHPRRLSPNNPWARRHRWDQLWCLPGDLNRKFEHEPHCSFIMTTRPPTRPWKPQSVTKVAAFSLFYWWMRYVSLVPGCDRNNLWIHSKILFFWGGRGLWSCFFLLDLLIVRTRASWIRVLQKWEAEPYLLPASCWFLARLTFKPWRWSWHVAQSVGWLSADYVALYPRS
jgi:hypothetical protein